MRDPAVCSDIDFAHEKAPTVMKRPEHCSLSCSSWPAQQCKRFMCTRVRVCHHHRCAATAQPDDDPRCVVDESLRSSGFLVKSQQQLSVAISAPGAAPVCVRFTNTVCAACLPAPRAPAARVCNSDDAHHCCHQTQFERHRFTASSLGLSIVGACARHVPSCLHSTLDRRCGSTPRRSAVVRLCNARLWWQLQHPSVASQRAACCTRR